MATAHVGYRAVGAIDLGHSYSCYAVLLRDRPDEIHLNPSWTKGTMHPSSHRTPTCILLKSDETFHSFGNKARDKYIELAQDEKHKDWYFFQHFKMLLYTIKNLTREIQIEDISGKTMKAIDVFSITIKYLKSKIEEYIFRKWELNPSEIQFVLTVPATLDDAAKQFMTESAIKAGMKPEQLILALEAEAGSIYLQSDLSETGNVFRDGTQYMVVDLGGGKVEIVVHKKESNTLRELHKATGGPWGGRTVDKEIYECFEKFAGSDAMRQLEKEACHEMLLLSLEVERIKFNIDQDERRVRIPFPLKLMDIMEKEIEEINALNDDGRYLFGENSKFVGNMLRLNSSFMKRFFSRSIHITTSAIESILQNREAGKDIHTIFLIGGFANSSVMQNAIQSKFQKRRIITPESNDVAVVKGAVLYGHNQSIISHRVLRFTYGIGDPKTTDKWIETIPTQGTLQGKDHRTDTLESAKITDGEVEFEFIARAGKSLSMYCHTITLNFGNDKSCEKHLLVYSDQYDGSSVNKTECRKIGKIKVETEKNKHLVIFKLIFGDTRIKSEATDDFEVSVDFLSKDLS